MIRFCICVSWAVLRWVLSLKMNSGLLGFFSVFGLFLNIKYRNVHCVTSPVLLPLYVAWSMIESSSIAFFLFLPFWVNISSAASSACSLSKGMLLKIYCWDAYLLTFSELFFSMVVITVTCLFCSLCVCMCVCNSFQSQVLCGFVSRCVKIEVASCQFGIIDMIQLREVTATLCIAKGPQWSHLCCWLWPWSPSIVWWRHVVMSAWLGLTCTRKQLGLFPGPIPSVVLARWTISSPSHSATVFLTCKIYLKMPFLKLLGWNQDKHVIGGPQWRSLESGRLGAIFMMLSLCKCPGLQCAEHGIHTVECVCV